MLATRAGRVFSLLHTVFYSHFLYRLRTLLGLLVHVHVPVSTTFVLGSLHLLRCMWLQLPAFSASCSGPSSCTTANGTRYLLVLMMAKSSIRLSLNNCFFFLVRPLNADSDASRPFALWPLIHILPKVLRSGQGRPGTGVVESAW